MENAMLIFSEIKLVANDITYLETLINNESELKLKMTKFGIALIKKLIWAKYSGNNPRSFFNALGVTILKA